MPHQQNTQTVCFCSYLGSFHPFFFFFFLFLIILIGFLYYNTASVEDWLPVSPQPLVLAMFNIQGPFEKFVDSPSYSESELCGRAVTVSFSKCIPWRAMHFLQRSAHFSKTCCKPFAASFRRIV
jgi:hypothetical protein